MITMILGLQGSAKTASCVREMMNNPNMIYYSNIITKGLKNNIVIKPEMISKKEVVQVKKSGEKIYKYSVNKEFWEAAAKKHRCLNIIIDEAHVILNARQGMTKAVQPILNWISLLRRVLGSTEAGYGKLYLVTQIERRLDVVAKEQATKAAFFLCHYDKICRKCGFMIKENNEVPDPVIQCPICAEHGKQQFMDKQNFIVEAWEFQDYASFISWKYLGKGKTFYRHYYMTDIEKVFAHYNTLQWENLLYDV
jgi:rubrerythrin